MSARVVILYEDKTAGGFHRLIEAIVTTRRNEERLPPLSYFKALPMKGNTLLLRECQNFERIRFFGPHKADHVFAVIDAFEVEKIIPGAPHPSNETAKSENATVYREALERAVTSHMCELALHKLGPKRQAEEERFHPVVLFWELESIFLAGATALESSCGLMFPTEKTTKDGILLTRHPTNILEDAWRRAHQEPYSKSRTGERLFGELLQSPDAWGEILQKMPGLSALIEGLLAL